MRNFLSICLLTLLLPSLLLADPPRAIITGPTSGVPGDFVELNGEEAIADHWLWNIEPARFSDGKVTYKTINDGKSLMIASRPGSYRVQQIVSNKDGIAFTWHTVVITDPCTPAPNPPNPNPNPNPDPAPTPTPIPPDKDRLGLASWVRLHALTNIPAADRPKLTKFADNLTIVSTQIAAGTIKTISEMNADILNRNRETAGTDAERARWGNLLIAPMGKKMADLRLTTMDQHKQALDELAFGLYSASK